MKTNTDLTLYNKITASGAVTYQRTVITAVVWENRKAANRIKSGMLDTDTVTVYVSFTRGTNYLKAKAFQALVTKTGKWTLQEGDYIVKGSVADEIAGSFTITSLKAKHDDVVCITSVDTMDEGSPAMQHWQIGGK